MKTVSVCIGSACHLKGSYDVISKIKEYIEKNNLENEVILKAAFCTGECTKAVSVIIDEGPVISVNSDTAYEFCKKYL
jgi:NADH:ubiquinone oxidoreductase subunit E